MPSFMVGDKAGMRMGTGMIGFPQHHKAMGTGGQARADGRLLAYGEARRVPERWARTASTTLSAVGRARRSRLAA
ncbi:hypothetical protein ROR02_28530 [Pararhodospirillum oryzae]|uniref:Uncharacterized protein n=1 Tax=Pararhodospirillum oryzae TaxID=478448 RepID=A0A512HBA5_9PROT|nr:hypothetical protein ROR02_28530 [Pararhodospirillum oryzae]